MAFLPELVVVLGALALFVVALGENLGTLARRVSLGVAAAAILACWASLDQQAVLFHGAYRVDAYSQWLKLALSIGFLLVLWLSGDLPDIRVGVKPEYFLFLTLGVAGLLMLVSSMELITLVVALELSSFPLYFLVAMRREREGQRAQMESAMKYIMFGVAANGIMLYGMSLLFGLTGTTYLPELARQFGAVMQSPLALVGLGMMFCGLYFKLAVFPFHFWTPDVYQGASNETAGVVASLPKLAAVAVLVRFVSLAPSDARSLAVLLSGVAMASMFYGNLVALAQRDLKRLLGFSGIAHAGYTIVGLVALDRAGFTASLYYMTAYVLMVLACFVVICRVSEDGENAGFDSLAGLHKRSPLLAVTLGVGVFALAGLPPFAGFMGKLGLLTAAFAKGHTALVIIMVVNAAIAVYYYLCMVREAWFRDPLHDRPLVLDTRTRALCIVLIAGILALGILPGSVMNRMGTSVADINLPLARPAMDAVTASAHSVILP